MIFRVYMLCWLAFACADEIDRVHSSAAAGSAATVTLGQYELGEVDTEPSGMPAQSEDATLKDVKFISKISATESLLITEKNVTWKYDEAANTLTKITYSGNKTYDNGAFVQKGTIEYGFSQHLLRTYIKSDQEARLVVTPSMTGTGGFSTPVILESNLYDKEKPPLILYLDAETKDRKVPSVLMFTKGMYVLNSHAMTCGGKDSISVKLKVSAKFDLNVTQGGVGGIASDGASFWVLTAKNFQLYVFHDCKQVEEKDTEGKVLTDAQGNARMKAEYDYKGFDFKQTSEKLGVLYKGESASKLPLGVWINISDKERPVIEGKIISISEEGKLLSADAPQ